MKKWIMILLTLMLMGSLFVDAHAATSALWDQAALLNPSETEAVNTVLSQTAEQLDMDVVIVTAQSLEGKSSRRYAEDFYDSHSYSDTGVLLLVSILERDYWVCTTGDISLDLAEMEAFFLPLLSAGDYEGAFVSFAEALPSCISVSAAGETVPFWTVPLVCAGIGLVAALITTLVMKSQLRSVRAQRSANSYVVDGSFQLTHSRDIYLFRNVSRTPKPKSNSSSVSGRSHGGGGGKF